MATLSVAAISIYLRRSGNNSRCTLVNYETYLPRVPIKYCASKCRDTFTIQLLFHLICSRERKKEKYQKVSYSITKCFTDKNFRWARNCSCNLEFS